MPGRLTAALIVALIVAGCATSPPASAPATAPPPAPPAAPTEAPKPTAAQAQQPPAAASTASSSGQPTAAPAKPASSPVAKSNAAYEQLLEAARKETKLVAWIGTPNLPETQTALFEAFKQRFGLTQLETEWLPISQNEAATRVVAESNAGRNAVDVVAGLPSADLQVDRSGVIQAYDWMGVFGQELPNIRDAYERSLPEFRGKTLVHWDSITVLRYNTELVPKDRLPTSIEELADPKWRTKFGLQANAASPFDTLSLAWGVERTLALADKIVANGPVFANSSPAVLNLVVSGSVSLAVGGMGATEREKGRGAPVDWVPVVRDFIPTISFTLFVPQGAPHPNVGRLFAAWLVTEGMKIQEQREFVGRLSDPSYQIGNRYRTLVEPNAPIVGPKSIDQVRQQEEVIVKINERYAAGR